MTNYIDKYILIDIIILVGGKMKKLDLEKIINTNKPELTFLVGKTLCGKTRLIQEITKKMIKKHIPTLLYCFEMPKTITINNIIERNSSELELNNLGIYLGTSCYIEKMYDQIKELKLKENIKFIMIDEICSILTEKIYIMGRGDIISIIIKKLKELSKELNIPILVTAPANIETREFKENPIKALSYFCKEQSAKDYVDKIILINGNIKDNNMNFIKKNI